MQDDTNTPPPVVTPPQPQIMPPQPPGQQPVVAVNPLVNEPVVGMSASQLGINNPSTTRRSVGGILRKLLIASVVLVVVIVGYLILKNSLSGTGSKSLTNGGYTYSFTFNKAAHLVQLSDGSSAYKYQSSEIAGVKPMTAPNLTSCSQIGSQWRQAFTVEFGGSQLPVCTPNDTSYAMYFTALNAKHLFTITFNSQQASTVYPSLQTIFGSVKVSH